MLISGLEKARCFEPIRNGEQSTTGMSKCLSSPHFTQYNQTSSPNTLQQAQTNALLNLLNLNQPVESSTNTAKGGSGFKTPPVSGPPVWKVLVLDQQTKDVLATVLRVQDLRDAGVTLHV